MKVGTLCIATAFLVAACHKGNKIQEYAQKPCNMSNLGQQPVHVDLARAGRPLRVVVNQPVITWGSHAGEEEQYNVDDILSTLLTMELANNSTLEVYLDVDTMDRFDAGRRRLEDFYPMRGSILPLTDHSSPDVFLDPLVLFESTNHETMSSDYRSHTIHASLRVQVRNLYDQSLGVPMSYRVEGTATNVIENGVVGGATWVYRQPHMRALQRSVSRLAHELSSSFPVVGNVTISNAEQALIDVGAIHGVESGDCFVIVREPDVGLSTDAVAIREHIGFAQPEFTETSRTQVRVVEGGPIQKGDFALHISREVPPPQDHRKQAREMLR